MIKLWLLNKDEEIVKQLDILSAKHTDEVNGENSLDFECYDEVNKKDRVIYKDHLNNWHEFIIEEIQENRITNTVYAEHSSYELRGSFIEDIRPTNNAEKHLEQLLSATRWTKGTIDGFGSKFISYYRQDVYKSISDMVEVFGAYRTFTIEVIDNKVTARKINIKKASGYDEGKRFTYTKDLIGVERTVLIGDIITALYGFGKAEEIGDGYGRRITFKDLNFAQSPTGQMYVTDDAARLEWGRNSPDGKQHIFAAYEFDDIEDSTELYHATKAKLAELNHPKVNYSAEVVLLDETFENVDAGDTVAIIDENFRGRELRLKGTVIKVVKDLVEPSESKIEIGNYIENVADSNKKIAEYIKNFRDKAGVWDKSNAFDEDGKLQGSYIKDMLGAWNDSLNGSGGYVYAEPGKGIITYDRDIDDNPTSAIQITGGGWRIANSKTPSGEWDWKTVGTGDGLAGEHILANSITVNKLASDVGASLDLSSNDSISLIVSSINTKIEEIELTPGPEGPKGESGGTGSPGADGKGITSTEIRYQKSTSGTETPMGQWQTFIPTVGESEYLWTRITIKYTTGPDSVSYTIGGVGSQGSKGDTGASGTDGKGISTTIVEYQKSGSGSAVPTGSWSTTLPAVLENEYLWTRTTITYTTGSPSVAYSVGRVGKDGAKGATGERGIPGVKGEDGLTTYTWVGYADNASGGGLSGNPTDKAYVGYAFGKTSATPVYTIDNFTTPFQLVKGADGVDGEEGRQGIPGEPGKNGRDNYTWVKYADTPTTGMSDNPTGKKYIGFAYNKATGTESTDYNLYEWNLAPNYFDEELTGIKTTVTTHTTAIRENKENIELSATKEEVETVETNFNDIMIESTERINENSSQIEVNADAITNEVIARETLDGNLREEINSKVQQTAEDFTVIFNKIEADQTLTSEELAVVTSHFRVNENGVIIGNSESAIEFFAENNRVGFRENGKDIAYWEEGTMNVDNLIAIVTVIIGYHLIEKYDSPTQGKTTIVRMG